MAKTGNKGRAEKLLCILTRNYWTREVTENGSRKLLNITKQYWIWPNKSEPHREHEYWTMKILNTKDEKVLNKEYWTLEAEKIKEHEYW
jgi:hypothetical protein